MKNKELSVPRLTQISQTTLQSLSNKLEVFENKAAQPQKRRTFFSILSDFFPDYDFEKSRKFMEDVDRDLM